MHARFWGLLILLFSLCCFPSLVTGTCNYGPLNSFYFYDRSLPDCFDVMVGPSLPQDRLPSNAEIETAKEEYFAYFEKKYCWNGECNPDLWSVKTYKYHFNQCDSENGWDNRVDLELKEDWLQKDPVTKEDIANTDIFVSYLFYNPETDKFEFCWYCCGGPGVYRDPAKYISGFRTGSCTGSGSTTGSGSSGGSTGSGGGTTGGGGGGGSTGIGIGTIAGVLIGGAVLIGGGYFVVTHLGGGGGGAKATSPKSGPQTPPTGHYENGQPYWGTGTKDDPFREYPDAKNPPYMPSSTGSGPIYGDGTAANPYRDYDQGRSIPAPTPATPPQPPPAHPKPSKTSKTSTAYKPAPKKPKPPSGPKDGDTKTVTDSRGQEMPVTYDGSTGKWVTDHGTEVDPGRIDKAKEDYQKDKDWSRDEHERIVEKSVDVAVKSFQPPPKPQMSQRTKDYLKGVYQIRAKYLTKETNAEIEYGGRMDNLVWVADWGEFGADLAIDGLANVTGPVGASIKNQYKAAKSLAKNLAESHVKGESYLKGVGKGLIDIGFERGFDKLKDTGLKRIDKRFNPTGNSKLSNLINPKSGDIKDLTPLQIADLVEKHGHGGWAITERTTSRLSRAAFAGTYKTAHGQAIKYLIKDPIKAKIGLKKAK